MSLKNLYTNNKKSYQNLQVNSVTSDTLKSDVNITANNIVSTNIITDSFISTSVSFVGEDIGTVDDEKDTVNCDLAAGVYTITAFLRPASSGNGETFVFNNPFVNESSILMFTVKAPNATGTFLAGVSVYVDSVVSGTANLRWLNTSSSGTGNTTDVVVNWQIFNQNII